MSTDRLELMGVQRWALRTPLTVKQPVDNIEVNEPEAQTVSAASDNFPASSFVNSAVKPPVNTPLATPAEVVKPIAEKQEAVVVEVAVVKAEPVLKPTDVISNDSHTSNKEVEQSVQFTQSNREQVVETKAVDSPDLTDFSAYAAASHRAGQLWLWVVDQPRLSGQEMNMLDKILTATESVWETVGIADSYIDSTELASHLGRDIQAVVFMSDKEVPAQFQGMNVLKTVSPTSMLNDVDKKREVWRDLQNLMKS